MPDFLKTDILTSHNWGSFSFNVKSETHTLALIGPQLFTLTKSAQLFNNLLLPSVHDKK